MARTVKVDLDLGGTAKEGVAAVGAEAKEAARNVKDVDQELKDTERDAIKAAAAMKLLGAESTNAGEKFKLVGDQKGMDVLDQRIEVVRTRMRSLADEFQRTGGNSDLIGNLFNAKRDLRKLEDLKKMITGSFTQAGDEAGGMFSGAFMQSFRGLLTKPVLGPASIAVLAPVIAALTPAINGALIAGVAMGGMATGIIGQLHDPAVHQGFVDFGQDFMTTLGNDTAAFKGPVLDSLHDITSMVHALFDKIDWGSLAKDLEPFIHAIGQAIMDLAPGINKMIDASGPVLKELGVDFQVITTSISDMFAMMSMGSTGAVEGLRLLTLLVSGLIVGLGIIVLVLSKVMQYFTDFGLLLGKVFDALGQWLHAGVILAPIGDALMGLGKALEAVFGLLKNGGNVTEVFGRNLRSVGGAAALTDDQLKALNDTLTTTKITQDTLAAAMVNKLFNSMMSIDQATLSVHQALTAVHESFVQNGRDIDENHKKGQANVQTVLAAVTANMALYQAQIAAGIGAADATSNYESNTRALHDQLRAAGLTETQVNGLIGKYKDVPRSVNTTIAIEGLTAAINNLGNLLAKVNGLDGRNFGFTVTQYLVTSDQRTSTRGNLTGGVYEHAAMGLLRADIYAPAGPARYAFAEPGTGGEGFVPRLGDYRRSTSIIDQEARWYGGRFAPGGGGASHVNNILVTVNAGIGTDGAAVGQQIANVLIPHVRRNGGNVQAVLGAQ